MMADVHSIIPGDAILGHAVFAVVTINFSGTWIESETDDTVWLEKKPIPASVHYVGDKNAT